MDQKGNIHLHMSIEARDLLTCENRAQALKVGASLLYHSATTALGLRTWREEERVKLAEERDRRI